MVNGRGISQQRPSSNRLDKSSPSPTSADTDRTPSLHLGFSCVKKKGRNRICRRKETVGRTDQADSPNWSSALFRFPRATGNLAKLRTDIKLGSFLSPIGYVNFWHATHVSCSLWASCPSLPREHSPDRCRLRPRLRPQSHSRAGSIVIQPGCAAEGRAAFNEWPECWNSSC